MSIPLTQATALGQWQVIISLVAAPTGVASVFGSDTFTGLLSWKRVRLSSSKTLPHRIWSFCSLTDHSESLFGLLICDKIRETDDFHDPCRSPYTAPTTTRPRDWLRQEQPRHQANSDHLGVDGACRRNQGQEKGADFVPGGSDYSR